MAQAIRVGNIYHRQEILFNSTKSHRVRGKLRKTDAEVITSHERFGSLVEWHREGSSQSSLGQGRFVCIWGAYKFTAARWSVVLKNAAIVEVWGPHFASVGAAETCQYTALLHHKFAIYWAFIWFNSPSSGISIWDTLFTLTTPLESENGFPVPSKSHSLATSTTGIETPTRCC